MVRRRRRPLRLLLGLLLLGILASVLVFVGPRLVNGMNLPEGPLLGSPECTVETADGDVNTGRIVYEDDNKLDLATNPFTTDTLSIAKKDLKAKSISKVSMMPQGLLDQFTKEEIFDLIAYLRSAGDSKDKAFK